RWGGGVMERRGGEPFNMISHKWFGRLRRLPSFLERHGVWGGFAAESAFLRGLGRCLGLEPIESKLEVGLVDRRLVAGDTFVYVHDKRVDEAGHTKDPGQKRAASQGRDRQRAG